MIDASIRQATAKYEKDSVSATLKSVPLAVEERKNTASDKIEGKHYYIEKTQQSKRLYKK